MTSAVIRVGISGWTYAPWRGVFYPKGLKRERELAFSADRFPAIEINGTFYSLQHPASFSSWASQVPAHLMFAIKAPRFITHVRRLREATEPLANFFASGVLCLGPHLGPILWQLPPNFPFNADRLDEFLRLLPRDTRTAAQLGKKHGPVLRGPAALDIDANRLVRHALEVRHESFRTPAFMALMRAHNVAVVCSDAVTWPRLMDVTADFIYCRLHGSKELYASGYDDTAIDEWAERLTLWADGGSVPRDQRVTTVAKRRKRDVFVFFDNDLKVAAPADAAALIRRLRE
jgi:uncharacterized protein YecE (DUF72 family)